MIDPVELSVSLGLGEEKEGGGRATVRLLPDHPRPSDVYVCESVWEHVKMGMYKGLVI